MLFNKKSNVKKMLTSSLQNIVLDEDTFKKEIIKERMRAERNLNEIIIVNINMSNILKDKYIENRNVMRFFLSFKKIINELVDNIRETDCIGWHKKFECLGIIFTGIKDGTEKLLENKIRSILDVNTDDIVFENLLIKSSVFPLKTVGENPGIVKTFYPDIRKKDNKIKTNIKRCIDITGSLCAIVTFLPLFVIIMIMIKLNSPGPVFFGQQRVGKDGKIFTMYKFRSMYCGVDDQIHRQYVSRLINGEISDDQKTFKIVSDPRITSIGYFLRKTSLDEIPQFINVLLGNMSLVGPRPPLTYETEQYKPWHIRRIYDAKPGITGIWQVEGRSSTNFDGMVRMDLKYLKAQSIILDMKLLLKTFLVFFTARGGY